MTFLCNFDEQWGKIVWSDIENSKCDTKCGTNFYGKMWLSNWDGGSISFIVIKCECNELVKSEVYSQFIVQMTRTLNGGQIEYWK